MRGGTGVVKKAEKKTASEKPPLLYDLTELRATPTRGSASPRITLRSPRPLRGEETHHLPPHLEPLPLQGHGRRAREAGRGRGRAPRAGAVRREAPGTAKLSISKRIVDDSRLRTTTPSSDG